MLAGSRAAGRPWTRLKSSPSRSCAGAFTCFAARCVDDDGGGTDSLQRREFRGEVERGKLSGQTDDFGEIGSDRGKASRVFGRERVASSEDRQAPIAAFDREKELSPSTSASPVAPFPDRKELCGARPRSRDRAPGPTPNPLFGTNRIFEGTVRRAGREHGPSCVSSDRRTLHVPRTSAPARASFRGRARKTCNSPRLPLAQPLQGRGPSCRSEDCIMASLESALGFFRERHSGCSTQERS